jgi:hypothetical protein
MYRIEFNISLTFGGWQFLKASAFQQFNINHSRCKTVVVIDFDLCLIERTVAHGLSVANYNKIILIIQ